MNDYGDEKNIYRQVLDLQHELFHYAQARQMSLIESSRKALEKTLQFYQNNHQRQIEKILDCTVL